MSCGPGAGSRAERGANLIIAGVGKSGTTSLFQHLGAHPDICPASVKETHFFSPVCYGRSLGPLQEYESFFSACRGERYRLEATPGYCTGGAPVIASIEEHLCRPRIIIILRNPVHRLHANYWYMRSKLRAQAFDSFESYVDDCLRLRDLGLDRTDEHRTKSWPRSFYDGFVGDWIDAFGERLRIIFFEEMIGDPRRTVVELCEWLELDPGPLRDRPFGEHNATREPRHKALQRVAVTANKVGATFLSRHPEVKARLRDAYYRVNGAAADRGVSPDVQARLVEAVRPSNRTLAAQLRRAGYDRFPPWLRDAEHDGG